MAKEIKTNKRKYNLYSIMGIIGDIIFYPIIILALLCCFAIYADKQSGKVPSILGVSMVSIKSGSMKASGFDVKDIVFLSKTNGGALRAGDIIGFYYYYDTSCDGEKSQLVSQLTLLQSYDRDEKVKTDYNKLAYEEFRGNQREGDRKTVDEINARADRLYFHRIMNVYIKTDGTIFYETQGDSNGSPETNYVCEDYVVGKYVYTPEFVRGMFSFVSTSTGMIVLVVAPLAILTLCLLFSIIEQISRIAIEKKVLRRQLPFNSDESINANIGIDMELQDKVWFFATSENAERREVKDFLWGYLENGKEADAEKFKEITLVAKDFEKSPDDFWTYFINTTKRKRMKNKINKAWHDWSIEKELKETVKTRKNSTKSTKATDSKEAEEKATDKTSDQKIEEVTPKTKTSSKTKAKKDNSDDK